MLNLWVSDVRVSPILRRIGLLSATAALFVSDFEVESGCTFFEPSR